MGHFLRGLRFNKKGHTGYAARLAGHCRMGGAGGVLACVVGTAVPTLTASLHCQGETNRERSVVLKHPLHVRLLSLSLSLSISSLLLSPYIDERENIYIHTCKCVYIYIYVDLCLLSSICSLSLSLSLSSLSLSLSLSYL